MSTFLKFHESQLVIASHNPGKIREIKQLLAPFGVGISTSASLGLIEPEENGSTYLENALIKARACVAATGLSALADDSGVEVMALGGEPGLHTAPYTKEKGGREKVFELWGSDPAVLANPKARFMCVQVLMLPDGQYAHFEGIVEGRLTFPPRGSGGHGYDPVFMPQGHDRTIAEMTLEEKNAFSHRFIALEKLVNACFAN